MKGRKEIRKRKWKTDREIIAFNGEKGIKMRNWIKKGNRSKKKSESKVRE